MSSPLAFLKVFAGQLRQANIRFAITSGMACVHYGLQQTTKDSDWIIAPEDLPKLRELFTRLENQQPPWRISYRSIFGAPLEAEYLGHGWTSHLLITDAEGMEHKVDSFGKPPRVQIVENEPGDPDYASRHVVALMKRTDRDRDWPVLDGIGWQMQSQRRPERLLHIQDSRRLLTAWQEAGEIERSASAAQRPLLKKLYEEKDLDRIAALVRAERAIWECVNQERYALFTRGWKNFFREWRASEDYAWPVPEPFHNQHGYLFDAVRRYELIADPVGAFGRPSILEKALRRAALLANRSVDQMQQLCPPITQLLP